MSRPAVPWALVALLGLSAALVAVPSVFSFWVDESVGLIVEPLAWTALYAVLFIPLLVRARPGRPILSGLLAGIFSGVTTVVIQSLMIASYWTAHPEAALTYADATATSLTLLFAATALGFGSVFGLLVGLIVRALVKRKDRQAEAADAASPA